MPSHIMSPHAHFNSTHHLRRPSQCRHAVQVVCSWQLVRGLVWVAIPFKFINDAAQFAGPYCLQKLLESVGRGDPPRQGYMLAVAMFVGLMTGSLADAQHFQCMMRAGEVQL